MTTVNVVYTNWMSWLLLIMTWWLPQHGHSRETHDLPSDPVLHNISEDFWEWKLKEFPELATLDGFHDFDDKLESYAYSTFANRVSYCEGLLSQLEGINRTVLSRGDRLTYDVLRDQLTTYIEGYHWRDYGSLNPINFMGGIHKSYAWVTYGKFTTLSDYKKYLQRLYALPRQIDEIIALLERAISLGRTNHLVSMRGVLEEISNITDVEAQSTPYYIPYSYILDSLAQPPNIRSHIRNEGQMVIATRVQPFFRRLKRYLETRYIPQTRPDIGIWSLPNGSDYYSSVLRWHLSVNMTAQQVHEIGLTEVKRISIEMHKLMQWLDFEGTMTDFFAFLRTKTEFFDHNEVGLLEKYKRAVYERIQPRLPQLFSNLSSIPNISIVADPRDGIDAQYMKGTMVINTFRPHTRPDFFALTLCLHEGVPGHHLQISFARNQPLPSFRRYIWPYHKYAAPFHFPYYTAYVEGWALYAEFLGEELALFNKPYELFGRYTFEIFRACRLVVDTGIHAMGWDREQAIGFLTNHTFMTRSQIEKEVDRYVTYPGQACAYKIGELKIKELRHKAMTRLGWRYSPQEFHKNVLEIGPVPLHLLEDHIDFWIEQNVPSVAHSRQMDSLNFASVMFLIFYRTFLLYFNLL